MPDRREREEQLPFLVNETLSADERADLERALAEDATLRDERGFLDEVRAAARAAGAAADPGDWPLRRALRAIEREERGQRRVHPVWRALALAAGLAVLVQAGVLVRQTLGPSSGMRTLGGSEAVRAGDRAVLQIRFRPEASEARVRELLAEAHATIVDGPSAAGLYRIALREVAAGDEAATRRALDALAAHPDVVAHVAAE